ncbi:predicted protein [Lichtheimia corymbifera JMRC:FSU:9682]|nr:predicted protein [Lichtheimia corymbifera JMRC:FSU:9682]
MDDAHTHINDALKRLLLSTTTTITWREIGAAVKGVTVFIRVSQQQRCAAKATVDLNQHQPGFPRSRLFKTIVNVDHLWKVVLFIWDLCTIGISRDYHDWEKLAMGIACY